MASFTMTSSFIGGAKLAGPVRTNNRCQVASKVSVRAQIQEVSNLKSETRDETNTRRNVILSAAVAAVCGIGRIAMAEDEPKRGTPEAKKVYAPICVTMPTAKICRR